MTIATTGGSKIELKCDVNLSTKYTRKKQPANTTAKDNIDIAFASNSPCDLFNLKLYSSAIATPHFYYFFAEQS
jgi:hypothetical protein